MSPLSFALALLLLAAAARAQDACKCSTHRLPVCSSVSGASSNCSCTLPVGPDSINVNCEKLLPKCLLMKRESLGTKDGRRQKHDFTVVDNDGLYNPDCENGIFKARQCNNTQQCWCVNSAGVRRTDKFDTNLKCDKLVRTFWIVVQLQLNGSVLETEVAQNAFKEALANTIQQRYKLPKKYISLIELEGPYIFIDLKQNVTESPTDPDIADVAYYLEKDIKGISQMPPDNPFDIRVNGQSVGVKEPLISYIDSQRPELSMKHLTSGVIAVIVVVVVAIVAGIVILVLTRRKSGQYQKAEQEEQVNYMRYQMNHIQLTIEKVKEMNEMQKELTS